MNSLRSPTSIIGVGAIALATLGAVYWFVNRDNGNKEDGDNAQQSSSTIPSVSTNEWARRILEEHTRRRQMASQRDGDDVREIVEMFDENGNQVCSLKPQTVGDLIENAVDINASQDDEVSVQRALNASVNALRSDIERRAAERSMDSYIRDQWMQAPNENEYETVK